MVEATLEIQTRHKNNITKWYEHRIKKLAPRNTKVAGETVLEEVFNDEYQKTRATAQPFEALGLCVQLNASKELQKLEKQQNRQPRWHFTGKLIKHNKQFTKFQELHGMEKHNTFQELKSTRNRHPHNSIPKHGPVQDIDASCNEGPEQAQQNTVCFKRKKRAQKWKGMKRQAHQWA